MLHLLRKSAFARVIFVTISGIIFLYLKSSKAPSSEPSQGTWWPFQIPKPPKGAATGGPEATLRYNHSKILLRELAGRKGEIDLQDQSLLKLLRKFYLDPPSSKPYHLKEDTIHRLTYSSYKSQYPSWIFINSILSDLFSNFGSDGFFVEAGALDGEFLSNSLQLERNLGWKGLLIEADEEIYKVLLTKNRKVWTSSACIATEATPYEAMLSSFHRQEKSSEWVHRGAGKIAKNFSALLFTGPGYQTFQKVICFPLVSILKAIKISHIDFFSLDVEGNEWEILKYFPFDEIKVDVWAIEHTRAHFKSFELVEDPGFISFMNDKDYYLMDVFCHPIADYVFVRRSSKIFQKLKVPQSFHYRKSACSHKLGYFKHNSTNLKLLRDNSHWPSIEFTHLSP